MTGFEFLLYVIWSILWPPKGIIYMEEQAIQWLVAFSHAWINAYGGAIITVIAIYVVIMFVVFERMPRPAAHGGIIGRIFRFVWSMIVVILFAWVFLIVGALVGQREGNRGERFARVENQYTNHITRNFGTTFRITRLSLHFRLGRAIYRFCFWLTGFIPAIARNNRLHEVLARVLAMVVILWGVWNIPYDITH